MAQNDTLLTEYSGLQLKIKKFNPMIATHWAWQMMGAGVGSTMGMREQLEKLITMDDRGKFGQLYRDCLSVVTVIMEDSKFPFINDEGHITRPEFESQYLLSLIVESFAFSMSDFFAPALIEGVKEKIGKMFNRPSDTTGTTSSDSSTGL